MRDLHKIDPHMVALHGSKEYIQRIIEDLLHVIKEQNDLAKEVMTLNPDCLSIGAGKMNNLKDMAKTILWN